MSTPVAATDYLSKPQQFDPRSFCVVFGDDAFLRREVLRMLRAKLLGGGDAELSLTTFDGAKVQLGEVLEELSTMAMFGGGQRVVVVDGADDFVSRYRGELEDEATHGRSSGVLILQVKSLPANTRLYKSVAANGLLIDANTPSGVKLPGWLSGWARSRHQAKLPKAAATLLVETAGEELGLLDQEIAKLALMAGPGGEITTEMVRQHVGGWRTRTTWDMLDAALDGNLPEALKQLDRLLGSGEQPIALLGQIGFSLRRLAATTRLVIQSERRGQRTPLRRALEEAGTRPFLIKKLEGQLRRLGRARGQRLYEWLLQADLDLKGASQAPPRVVLERLIVRLAAPADVVGA